MQHTPHPHGTHHTAAWKSISRWIGALASCVMPWLANIAIAASGPVAGPSPMAEAGLPFIHNFDPAEYGGAPQNWAVTQGRDGIIYVGNVEDGVLAFDGVRWRRILIPDRMTVRSLATAPDGRIYVGAVGDFGYLKRDASGQLAYASLRDMVPPDARNFSDVWHVHVTDAGVYFTTVSKIFHLRDGRIKVIKPQTSFHLSFDIDGMLYIREVDRGLMRIVGDRLQPVAGGDVFADKKVYALLPWEGKNAQPGQLLAGTRSDGWLLFDGTHWKPWHMDADAALKDAAIYNATWLSDGRLAVATLRGGLFLLDAHGQVLRRLTRTSGLGSNVVLALFQDRQHGLWLALDKGIARVDVDAPLTHFGERSGLQGAVLSMIRHDGILYVGTTEGVFRLVAKDGGDAYFERLTSLPGWNYSLLSFGDQLLVANYSGVFAIDSDGSARQLLDPDHAGHTLGAQPLLRLQRQPSRVLVGYQDGLGVLRWSGSRWIDEGLISGVREQSITLGQDAARQIWMGVYPHDIERLTLPDDWQGPGDPRAVKLDRFGTGAGLPEGQQDVVMIDGKVRFITSLGIYRFNAATQHFAPDADFEGLFPDGPRQISALHQARSGELWMYTIDDSSGVKETGRAQRVDGRWKWVVTPLQPIFGTGIYAFREDPDGVVWIGGDDGVFRYDPQHGRTGNAGFSALIRKVAAHDGRVLPREPADALPEIPYAQNALRFEFAAPSFDFYNANSFQVLLQGVDRGWSPWSSDAYRDYTNIHEGRYRFLVRARNVYGEEGKPAEFDFRVLPPWYRTDWAWLLWIASGVLVAGLFLRWRSAALRRRNSELMALVDLRTAELAQANDALQSSNDKLAEQNVTDPLTGMKNRRYLYDHIARDVAMSRRNCRNRQTGCNELPVNSGILFLMVDIDHFKGINDGHGHAAGDQVLQQISDVLQSVTRETDIAIRWGGEEFLIVARFALPDAGPQFAERIRAAVAAHRFDVGNSRCIQLTCSVGFATYPTPRDEPDRLTWSQVLGLADECLYAAKHHGRNAWAGVMPLLSPPDREIREALCEALMQPPGTGTLRVETSWTRVSVG